MKCFDTFRLAAIAALLLGIIGCAKEEYIEIPLELDQQGSALVAPLKVDLSSGLTKSFDASNRWYWEPSDVIYGYQCTGSFYENDLTQVDSENAPGVFSVENFRYSTSNPAPILFVYKGKEHSIGTWSNNVTISTYSSKQQGKWDPVIVGCLPNVTMPLNGGTVDMQYLTSAIEVRYWKEGTTSDSMLDANRKTIKYINLKRNSGDLLLNVQCKQNPDGTISFEDKRTNERSEHVWAENVNASSVVFNISPQLEPYIFGDLVVEIHDENDIRNTFTVPSVPLEPGKKLVLNQVANMPTGPQLNKILKEFLRYRSTVTRLCVVTNSTQTSDNALVAGSVYMVVNGEALELHTAKSELVMDADCSSLFERLRYLEEIDMRGMNFRKITNMSKMFAGCSALKSIDLSHINTSNVTNMSGLFGRSYEYSSYLACSSLTNINLGSNFNTDKVTDMSWMFASCNSLPMSAMNLSRFNTANVINMQYMFAGNTQITSFDFSMLNYSNVTDMSAMFENCINLTKIDMTGQSYNTSKVLDMGSMFRGCTNLRSVKFAGAMSTSNVTTMSNMFRGCTSLESIDFTGFVTNKVTEFISMFQNCSSLESLDLSMFDTQRAIELWFMFNGCTKLQSINLSNFTTPLVETFQGMFQDCSSLTNLDLSKFSAKKALDVSYMFSGCENLQTLDISNFNIGCNNPPPYFTAQSMFKGCKRLSEVDLTRFNMRSAHTTSFTDAFLNLGELAEGKPINILVSADGYDYFTNPNRQVYYYHSGSTGINNDYAQFVVRTHPLDRLVGSYNATGLSSNGTSVSWAMALYEDASDDHTIWFYNINNMSSSWAQRAQYKGTVSDDLSKIVIQFGQESEYVYSNGNRVVLAGLNAEGYWYRNGSTTVNVSFNSDGKAILNFGDEWGFSTQLYYNGKWDYLGLVKPTIVATQQ